MDTAPSPQAPATVLPCGWIDEETDIECGAPSITSITVRGRIASAKVPVCPRHKSKSNDSFARLRHTSKTR